MLRLLGAAALACAATLGTTYFVAAKFPHAPHAGKAQHLVFLGGETSHCIPVSCVDFILAFDGFCFIW